METCRAFIVEMMDKKHKGPHETFRKNLQWMKEMCVIRDATFWDMKLQDGETPFSPAGNEKSLCLQTVHGFRITIRVSCIFSNPRYLIGTLQLPPHFLFTSWLRTNAFYEALCIYAPTLTVDVHHVYGDMYEWRHENYTYDANMALPLSGQFTPGTNGTVLKHVSGPVQILEEARNIMTAVMMKESQLKMDRIREEFMMKAFHPQRILKWEEQGFDSFCEF